jgi:ABC-type branched-subunit amino acid transport system ATPase component
MRAEGALLEVSELVAGYLADVNILTGINLILFPGEIVTVVGPNGAGKSTLLKVMFGLLRPRQGSVRLKGERIDDLRPYKLARRGMGYVPG